MMKVAPTLTGTLLLLVPLLQTACAGGKSDAVVYNDLVLRFHADQSRAQVGKPIRMQFSVTNEGTQTYALESKQIPVMDIDVEEAGTQQVYLRWSAEHPDQVAHRLEWKPGESKVIELVWTPQPDQIFQTAHLVYLTGILHEDQRGGVQAVTVSVCAESCR